MYAQDKMKNRSSTAPPTSAPANASQSSGTAEPVALETPIGTLHGTLLLPSATKMPFPVALIIAGSGPTDRDGNTPLLPGANNSLKYFAEGLAAQGIASVRYDKRGIAASAVTKVMREEDLSFDTYIEDAVAWVRKLRGDKRFSTITIIGHSEGSLIGMVAAERARGNAFVSIAGAGRSLPDAILVQARSQKLPPELMKSTEEIVRELRAGRRIQNVPEALLVAFRPSVQPYLISAFKYEPPVEIAKLKVPVMIAQGTTDVQVSVEEARLLQTARPSAKLLVIEGMNHVLKAVAGDLPKQFPTYSDSTLPVVPQLITEIGVFVKSVKKHAS